MDYSGFVLKVRTIQTLCSATMNQEMALSVSVHSVQLGTVQATSKTQTWAHALNQKLSGEDRVDGSGDGPAALETMQQLVWCVFGTVDVQLEWRMWDCGARKKSTLEKLGVQRYAHLTANSLMRKDFTAQLAGINVKMEKNTRVFQHALAHAPQEQLFAVPKV